MNGFDADRRSSSASWRNRSHFGAAIALLAIVLGIGFGVALIIEGASSADSDRALGDPTAVTVALESLPTEMAALYHYAADKADAFATIPCYCGCDRSLNHRSLKDCFITPQGGWDAHASGCGVCNAEATTAKELFDKGVSVPDVRQQIINRYGPRPALKQGQQP